MSDKKKIKNNKLSIYLIKEGVKFEDVLKDYNYQIMSKTATSTTYYLPSQEKRPVWLFNYFKFDEEVNICNSHAKVVSLHRINFENDERIFAIPFGNGKYLLKDEVIEEQFGIKVLLNTVKMDGFRQIIASDYSGDFRVRTEQMPKRTNISEFGFDIYSDFLRKATAKSDDEIFGNNVITGGDLFCVSVPKTVDDVDEFLEKCYIKYKSKNYLENFSWLDNIKEVREKSKKEELNEKLIVEINNRNFEKVWMAVPEVIEWEKVSDFRFREKIEGEEDIEIEKFIETFDDATISNIQRLKSRKVYAMQHGDDEPLEKWSAFNCLIGEIELNDGIYCLNFGKWYKVDRNFVDEILEYYENVPISQIEFIDAKQEKEDEYNKKLSENLNNSILMDKQLISVRGVSKNSIEVCDVLTENNELIHIKKNGGSSYLSHLFNQAAVSGEYLLDSNFRDDVNSKFLPILNSPIFTMEFTPKNYKIILGIITKYRGERPKIPFFSKVTIQYAIDGLKRKGYMVEIKNIFNSQK